MQLISEEYRLLNEQLHKKKKDKWANSGNRWAHIINFLCKSFYIETVLDYGSGTGSVEDRLIGGITYKEYDPCIKGKDKLPKSADLVLCMDVLEHIEPEYLTNVLSHINRLTKKIAFFVIATRKARIKLADGRNAHLIVKPSNWWIKKLYKWNIYPVFKKENWEFACVVSKNDLLTNLRNIL